jgi:hypothetical protein
VILALKIIAVVVVVLMLVGIVLRIRKLRRDEMRELSRPVERRLVAPPPSPYQPSKGFRLLDESGQPVARPPIEPPRLDPNRRYVFNELSGTNDDAISSHLRHNDDWFLSRSSQRSTLSIVLRRLTVFVVIALIVATVATYYVDHHRKDKGSTTTTSSTTTTTFPTSLTSTKTVGDDVYYNVPAAKYQVVVRGLAGPTSVTFASGASNTVAFQGTVQKGDVESKIMTGNSQITIDSPLVASVHVEGSPVIFPSPLPSTLVLVFTSKGSASSS